MVTVEAGLSPEALELLGYLPAQLTRAAVGIEAHGDAFHVLVLVTTWLE